MSGSRFVLKQIHVRGAGSSDLTRYVAKSKLDMAREGKSPRELFTADADNLTFREARKWLSITGGALDKEDVLHYVLSFENAREYEFLGADEGERKHETVGFLRQAIAESLQRIGIEEMRWVAGIHRNTDNPHIHLLLNKNGIGGDTKDLVRVPRLAAPIIAHHTKTPDGRREFSYGSLINSFAAQLDAKHRDRSRFLQVENALRTVSFTRALLSPDTLNKHPPTDDKQYVGKWIVAEIEAAYPPKINEARRAKDFLQDAKDRGEWKPEADEQRKLMNLRESIALLDSKAQERGDEPTPAFIETEVLRRILTAPQHGLSVMAHERNPHLEQPRSHDLTNRQLEHIKSMQHVALADAREQHLPESKDQTHILMPPARTR